MDYLKLIKIFAGILPAIAFAKHSYYSFLGNETMLQYIQFVIPSLSIAQFLLIGVGILDAIVVFLIFYKPNVYVGSWTTLWPVIPSIIAWQMYSLSFVTFLVGAVEHALPGAVFLLTTTKFFETEFRMFEKKFVKN